MSRYCLLIAMVIILLACLLAVSCDDDDDDDNDDNDNDAVDDDDDDIADDDDDNNDDITDDDASEDYELWALGRTEDLDNTPESESWGFFLHYKQGAWSMVLPPDPVVLLNSISCASADKCLAEGSDQILRYDGAQWAMADAPSLRSDINILDVLSLNDADWAVGGDNDSDRPLAWLYEDGAWQATDTSGLVDGYLTGLIEVSGQIFALGTSIGDEYWEYITYLAWFDPAIDQWVEIHRGFSGGVGSIAYANLNWAITVGSESNPPMYWGTADIYQDGQWEAVDAGSFPDSYESAGSAFTDCAALAPGDAWILGIYGSKVWTYGSTVYHLQDGQWSDAVFEEKYLAAMKMIDAEDGWIAGYELFDGTTIGQGVVLRYRDGQWVQQEITGPTDENWMLGVLTVAQP